MEVRELTCIGCPLGCQLTVTMGENEIKVEGNTCPRGEAYAKKEVTNPTRIVTSTVRVEGGTIERVSVKTASDIPKGSIFECMKEIHGDHKESGCTKLLVNDEMMDGNYVPVEKMSENTIIKLYI